ncbi:ABC transporter substrate-binding protein [Consotaella aegiceratis]|uniref:ABC transporter substrate-binding protein n=1 Tax=Consotaella aegiceratis TaxID=3097961 RepID=UPI002F3E6FB3
MSRRAAALSFALAATLSIAAPLHGRAQELTPVKFTLDFRFEGPSAGFLLAKDKGYFEENGVDVTIDTGNGSLEAIPRITTGTYNMGFGDINALIKFLDENPDEPIEAVMMVYNKPAFAVVGRADKGITDDPKSLEGKTLGAPPPDSAYAQWPVFAKLNDIDTSTVKIENVGFPLREPMLAQGDVDAVFGFSFTSAVNLKAQGIPEDNIVTMLMADHGLDLYGNAIMVNTEWAEANPDAVKSVLAAIVHGFKDALANPEEGVEAVMKANNILTKETEIGRLEMANELHIATDWVKENGFGGIDEERMAKSIDLLKTSMGLKNPPSVDRVFDDSYLPPKEERMLQ